MSTISSVSDIGPIMRKKQRKSRSKNFVSKVLLPTVVLTGLVGVWQAIITIFNVQKYVVPSPGEVWAALVLSKAILIQNLWPTAWEALLGFLVGNGVAILLAVVFVHSKFAERAFMPVAIITRSIPIVAIAPVLVLLLGTGYAPKVAIAALVSFFPTLVNMVRGFESVSKESLELFRVLSASKSETFWKLRVYASLPFLFSALKIAAASSVIGAIIAEWIGSMTGIGFLIIQSTYNFNTPLLYATMAVASLMAIVFYAIIGLLERRIVTWNVDSVA